MAATLAEDVLHELFFSACGNSNEIETVAKMAYILRRFASKCLLIKVELSTIEFLSQWYRQFQFTNDSLAAKKIKDFLEKCSLSDYPNFNDFSVALFRNIVDQSILLEALVVSLPSKDIKISLIEYLYSQICIYDLLLLAGKSKFDLRFFSMLLLIKIQRIVSGQESEHSIKLQNVLNKMRELKYTSLEVIKSIVEEITVTMCETSLCFDRKQLCLYAGVDNTGQTKITVKMIEEYTVRIRNADPEVKSVVVLLQRGALATTTTTLPNTSSNTTAGQVNESNDIVVTNKATNSSPPTSPATTVETDDIVCDPKAESKSTQPLPSVQMQQIQQHSAQQSRPTLHTPVVLPVADSSASNLDTSRNAITKSHCAPSNSSNSSNTTNNHSDTVPNGSTKSIVKAAVNNDSKPIVLSSSVYSAQSRLPLPPDSSSSNVTVTSRTVTTNGGCGASPYSRTSTLSWDDDDDICFSSEKPVPAKKLEPVVTRPSRRQQQQHQQQQKQQKPRNVPHEKQNQQSTHLSTVLSTHSTQHSLAYALSNALQYKPSLHIVSNNASILVGDSGAAYCAVAVTHQIDTCNDGNGDQRKQCSHSGDISSGSAGSAVTIVNPNNDAALGLGAAPQEGNVVSPPSQQSTASTDDNHISNNNSDNSDISSGDINSNSSSCDSSEYQDYHSSSDLALICPQDNDIAATAANATASSDNCDDSALIKRLFSDCCAEEQGDDESGRDEEAIRESRESALCDWLSDVLDQNHSSDTAAAANNLILSTTSGAGSYSISYSTTDGNSVTSSAVVTPTFTATPGKDAANGGYSYFNSCFSTSYNNNNSNGNGSTSVEKCREGEEISPAVRVGNNISSSGGGTRKLKRKLTGGR